MAKKKALASDKALLELREFGLEYPGAHTKSPWPGHMDLAVNDKTFAYLSIEGEPFSIGCKLPQSAQVALLLPFCKPTPYGLGKSGWVTAQFPEGRALPVDMLKEWIDESYRAQAPKKLLKELGGAAAAPAKSSVKKSKPVAKRTSGSAQERGSGRSVTRGAGTTKKRAKKRVS